KFSCPSYYRIPVFFCFRLSISFGKSDWILLADFSTKRLKSCKSFSEKSQKSSGKILPLFTISATGSLKIYSTASNLKLIQNIKQLAGMVACSYCVCPPSCTTRKASFADRESEISIRPSGNPVISITLSDGLCNIQKLSTKSASDFWGLMILNSKPFIVFRREVV